MELHAKWINDYKEPANSIETLTMSFGMDISKAYLAIALNNRFMRHFTNKKSEQL